MPGKPPVARRTLRGSGQPISALEKAKAEQEKVPGRGTKQLTAIEKARLKKR